MHELPDDLTRWPTDPYALLGVTPGVLPRDLKKAYTGLIRIWKPEQHPEHFRRIREAYESILAYVRYFGAAPAAQFSTSTEPVEEEAQPRSTPSAEEAPFSAAPSLQEQLDEAWNLACQGQEADAYARLVSLHGQHYGNEQICLRLYWLLGIEPALDAARAPGDWLAIGLKANHLTGPLRELYRRELSDHPAEALTPRCATLLETTTRPGLLGELVDWRWQAASRTAQWDTLVANDLLVLRERLLSEDEETWCRLLFSAADLLAWGQGEFARSQLQRVRRDVEQLEHLHTRLANEMDRHEFLLELSTRWHELRRQRDLPAALIRLIPLSWGRHVTEYQQALLENLEGLARGPQRALDLLDTVQDIAPPVMVHLANITAGWLSYRGADREDREPHVLRELVVDQLNRRSWRLGHTRFRREILVFCVQECIGPHQVAALIEGIPEFWLNSETHLAERIGGDWPLRCAWLAHRAFWA